MDFFVARGTYHFKLQAIWPPLSSYQLSSPGHAAYDCYNGGIWCLRLTGQYYLHFPQYIFSPYRLKLSIISPSNIHWQPPGPLEEHRPIMLLPDHTYQLDSNV